MIWILVVLSLVVLVIMLAREEHIKTLTEENNELKQQLKKGRKHD